MRRSLAMLGLAALLASALSGCSGPANDVPQPTAAATTMSIVGVVQDEGLAGVPGANVSLRLVGRSTTTDGAGAFRFDRLTVSAYLVDVNATGFEPQSLTAEPQLSTNASLNFVLRKATFLLPRTEVTHVKGILQCAAEALIISGSCDLLVKTATGEALFEDTSSFQVALGRRWDSVVVDVDFDPGAHPGFDGLRLVVRGLDASDKLNNYSQYGRFNGAAPFTARLDVNGTYADGIGPVPPALSAIELVVYPQGYAWHSVCEPECFAGVGAGNDVKFDLYVTVFYNRQAPDGYSLLT